jgi:predicted transcriptional regulator of viral defense system
MTQGKDTRLIDRVLRFVGSKGAVTGRDLEAAGYPRQYLQRLYERGLLQRVARGLYSLTDSDVTELHTLVEAACRIPNAVACLLTALRVHELTTQNPRDVWLAVRKNAWARKPESIPVRFVYMSGPAFDEGVDHHEIEGVTVRVFGAAKTVADCFKYRSRIGVDAAIEALSEYRRSTNYDADALWRFATICRVSRVMRPYMEAVG